MNYNVPPWILNYYNSIPRPLSLNPVVINNRLKVSQCRYRIPVALFFKFMSVIIFFACIMQIRNLTNRAFRDGMNNVLNRLIGNADPTTTEGQIQIAAVSFATTIMIALWGTDLTQVGTEFRFKLIRQCFIVIMGIKNMITNRTPVTITAFALSCFQLCWSIFKEFKEHLGKSSSSCSTKKLVLKVTKSAFFMAISVLLIDPNALNFVIRVAEGLFRGMIYIVRDMNQLLTGIIRQASTSIPRLISRIAELITVKRIALNSQITRTILDPSLSASRRMRISFGYILKYITEQGNLFIEAMDIVNRIN